MDYMTLIDSALYRKPLYITKGEDISNGFWIIPSRVSFKEKKIIIADDTREYFIADGDESYRFYSVDQASLLL